MRSWVAKAYAFDPVTNTPLHLQHGVLHQYNQLLCHNRNAAL